MSENFGSGIYLTRASDLPPNWDIDVDSSGDIRTVSGDDELQKDIAFASTINLGNELGSRITPVVLNRIKARVRDTLNDDERIDVIVLVSASEVDRDTVEVVVEARASDENVELVFEVDT